MLIRTILNGSKYITSSTSSQSAFKLG